MIYRRRFFGAGGALIAGALLGRRASALPGASLGSLPPWRAGNLDIHHIDTGRGNATFVLGPDGTTLLIDCGASNSAPGETAPPRPDGSRRPGQWVARYILRHARAVSRTSVDYMLATHIHPDHVGDVLPSDLEGPAGYIPTGMSEVDAFVPATKVIDRAFPHYGALPPPSAAFASNYLAWLGSRVTRGLAVEAARAGSGTQIVFRRGPPALTAEARIIASSGEVWTGSGEGARSVFPELSDVPLAERPSENQRSIALKLTYGKFAYFTGGDLNFDTQDGLRPWADVETPAASVTGRVEVATANHHGYFDAVGPEFVRLLDAQAYVVQAWHQSHPGPAQIERMLGAWPGRKARDVFALESLAVNRAFNSRFAPLLKSSQGHVVVRVSPGGATYMIYVLDSSNEDDEVLGAFGPYVCRD